MNSMNTLDEQLRVFEATAEKIGAPISENMATIPVSKRDLDPMLTINPWPDPLNEAAYHGLAGEFVRMVEPESEADPVAILLQFLTAAGSVIGRGPHFVAEGTCHFTNLFMVLVGQTSKARKGSSWSHVLNIFQACDEAWARDRVKSGLSSGEGLIWNVRDPIYKQEPVKEGKQFTGEYQEICIDPGIEDKRLLAQEAEFASLLHMPDRSGNTLSPIIRKAWESGNLESLTKNSPAKATNAHISIVGHIVKDEVRRYLSRTEAGSGFGNRFLWVCATRSKCLPEGGRIDQLNFAPLIHRLKAAIDSARATGELHRDEGAREIWRAVYPELSEGVPGMLGAVTSRAEAQVMRLACLYALLDGTTEIKAMHLRAALAVWEYCEASARFIFGDALGDPIGDEILTALRNNINGLTRTEISHLFHGNRDRQQIGRSMGVLLEYGLARMVPEETGGRKAERWFVT